MTPLSQVRPKLESLIGSAQALVAQAKEAGRGDGKRILVHCWRGGMRSCALAWLLQNHGGLDAVVLKGGYKAFRQWQAQLYCYLPPQAGYKWQDPTTLPKKPKIFVKKEMGMTEAEFESRRTEEEAKWLADAKSKAEAQAEAAEEAQVKWAETHEPGPRVCIIAGRTGSGKTKVLHALRDALGAQIIDLEGLAHHNGSAFGFVGHEEQPTPQQYGNDVAMAWHGLDKSKWVFVEDEGTNVGKVSTPVGLYRLMRSAPVVLRIVLPMSFRIQVLLDDYTGMMQEKTTNWQARMEHAVKSLEKRIGKEKCDAMLSLLKDEDYATFANEALQYYDKLYDKHFKNAEGTGGGGGERAGISVDVEVPEGDGRLDPVAVGRSLLDALAECETSLGKQ